MYLSKTLKSRANLTVLSLFTLITNDDMKFLSEQLINFMMCILSNSFLSSSLFKG